MHLIRIVDGVVGKVGVGRRLRVRVGGVGASRSAASILQQSSITLIIVIVVGSTAVVVATAAGSTAAVSSIVLRRHRLDPIRPPSSVVV